MAVQIGETTTPQIGLSDYTLMCTISGALNRNASYQWFKDNGTQMQRFVVTNSSILSFSFPLKLSDAGNYTCEISIARESPGPASSVMAMAEASWVVIMESKCMVFKLLIYAVEHFPLRGHLTLK